ncbi:hypothetical protein DYB25_007427 [Aphanomyces astaci]|uniref:Peptidase M48 domain-containing protein n=1 Tax=Aphanomyces astaci TaxID=112090 RepID=A0A397FH31_APHAT|nr:hypothetical protein DYB25_007427 [Aphanomyces astaci]RHY33299.1 hypothetical protein DYB34_008074 [Aphanomyces astaci]RHY53394.1 hypothetical protein DYB38_005281 [Aphanomyces astaci]RHY63968.1 hypothetical protein DYB30_001117 [Aphanomyces astaci]RHZ23500.1 hypothetical protein DYB31_011655 [Aphanomyces astaci]
MFSRAIRRVAATGPKFTRGKYSIRVSKEKDVSFATAHVDDPFHHFVLNGCWGLTALATSTAFYQFVTNLHTVPITGRTQEMGNQHAKEALAGKTLVNSGPRFKMVKDVATRLVAVADKIFEPGFQWQIYVQGICSNKYNALATVLGHEIAHALARHTAETLSYLPVLIALSLLTVDSELIASIFTYFCQLPFSRLHETEADHIGLMLMAAACYDPSEAPKFWEGMKLVNEEGIDWFSTHPADDKRQKHLEQLTAEAIAYQDKASWCGDMQSKVSQLIYKRITRRRATAGTTHSAEMAAMWDGMQATTNQPPPPPSATTIPVP